MRKQPRRALRIDDNQKDIVDKLMKLPGISVDVGHDDIIVGWQGKNFWYEVKKQSEVSRKTGEIRSSALTHTERNRLMYWPGHYKVVWTFEQILEDMGYERTNTY